MENDTRMLLYWIDAAGVLPESLQTVCSSSWAVTGLHPRLLGVLAGWLVVRQSVVIVKCVSSTHILLANSVFQGTTWGPSCGTCITDTLGTLSSISATMKRFTPMISTFFKIFDGSALTTTFHRPESMPARVAPVGVS